MSISGTKKRRRQTTPSREGICSGGLAGVYVGVCLPVALVVIRSLVG